MSAPEPLIDTGSDRGDESSDRFTIVVPSIGRPVLADLLADIAHRPPSTPVDVIVVDDRPDRDTPLPVGAGATDSAVRIVAGRAKGPAAARNTGWRAASTPWIVFVDDDVRLAPNWFDDLVHDLATADRAAGAVYGRLQVPRPADRAPTDDERATLQLEEAGWITADAAVRRTVLEEIGGFDERFPRAYREDTDLVLRILDAGHVPVMGRRRTRHPLRQDGRWSSVKRQLGNIDDALLDRIHGPIWRVRVGADRGMLRRHAATTVAMGFTAWSLLRGRRGRAVVAGALSAASFLDFYRRRLPGGLRDPREAMSVAITSLAIPPVATAARLWGDIRARRLVPAARSRLVGAVLFDRDGTLVHDVPYNGDPDLVAPVPGARDALDRLRVAGIRLGVVSNQRGLALGRFDHDDLDAVNARLDRLLGPFPVIACCPHDAVDSCECRKPEPGLVHAAAARLGVDPADCVVVGDIGADVRAAAAAGAGSILVPTPVTRPEEIRSAPTTATDLHAAVDLILRGHR